MCPPAAATSRSTPRCPATGTPGRPVAGETVRSLVLDTSRADLSGNWHYCGVQDCGVVYFDADGRTIEKSELKVRVGEKERDPPYTVCYCFGHTVEDIRDDIVRNGRTTIPDDIKARVKAGECSCEVSNPKGTCCLGDVAREVGRAEKEAAVAMPDGETSKGACSAGPEEDAGCCEAAILSEPDTRERETGRTTFAALGLSGLTAIGASACCWLPLLLVALGASSAGVAATFEGLRPVLLVVAPMLIGFSFYLIYLRRAPCAKGSGCEVRRGNKSRTVRAFFWVAVALLGFSIAFPSAMSALLGGTGPTQDERLASLPSLELRISGMTCETCAAGVRTALLDVVGVVDAAADHERGAARVWYEPAPRPREAALRAAVEGQGYEVEAIGEPGPSPTQERRVVHIRAAGMVKSLGIT
ncbi:MAG: mercuric transporter MerT family protein [Dehalococcoidia bacterium]